MADAKTEKQKVKEITDKLEGTGYEGDGEEFRTGLISFCCLRMVWIRIRTGTSIKTMV